MLVMSNIDVPETLQKFKDRGIPVGFLVPTETGLTKSIMDAHDNLRRYLANQGIHDYQEQSQGTDNRRLVPTLLFSRDRVTETTTSLYRPETKKGDPRIWVYKLSANASPGDLIAICAYAKGLVAINCSHTNLDKLFAPTNAEFRNIFSLPANNVPDTAAELLGLLSDVSSQGYINTLRRGDTGVGFTLETLLGIRANSSREPDFNGIELKASRARRQSNKQTTVFSQVPDWSLSNLKGSKKILEKHGRYNPDKDRIQLFHEISCKRPNSYNMQLEVTNDVGKLYQIYLPDGDTSRKERDVVWLMDKLVSRLEEKHQETMWVNAETRGTGASEEFWYTAVKHTTGVDSAALPILLETGSMTVHYLIKETPTGAAKDQGYLFKMASRYLPTLFEKTVNYDLTEMH